MTVRLKVSPLTAINGFSDLQGSDGPRRFTIERSGDPTHLPKSHTCAVKSRLQPTFCTLTSPFVGFNRLDLPPYTSMEQLDNRLSLAVDNTVGAFSLSIPGMLRNS